MQDAWPSPAVCKILLGKVKGDGDPVVRALWRGMTDPASCNSWGELHESLFLPEEGSKSSSEEQRYLMSLLPPYLLESKRFSLQVPGWWFSLHLHKISVSHSSSCNLIPFPVISSPYPDLSSGMVRDKNIL